METHSFSITPKSLAKITQEFRQKPTDTDFRKFRATSSIIGGIVSGSFVGGALVSISKWISPYSSSSLIDGRQLLFVAIGVLICTAMVWQILGRLFVVKAVDARKEEVRKAAVASNFLVSLLDTSEKIALQDIPNRIAELNSKLDSAEREYVNNAYSPFWDNIESITAKIGTLKGQLTTVESYANDYDSMLHGKDHNFPPFYVLAMLPDISPTLMRFQRIVRLGQTNFQFATIWEQRKTRQAIAEGFATLGDAVNNVATQVEIGLDRVNERIRKLSQDIAWQSAVQNYVTMRSADRIVDAISRR